MRGNFLATAARLIRRRTACVSSPLYIGYGTRRIHTPLENTPALRLLLTKISHSHVARGFACVRTCPKDEPAIAMLAGISSPARQMTIRRRCYFWMGARKSID